MQIDVESLRGFLGKVARERSPQTCPRGLEETSLYLTRTLAGFGYTVLPDSFTVDGEVFANLVASRKPGLKAPFILGAHYDAVEGSSGADDNASGVAVLLEVARLLADHPASEQVEFVAFTLEEWNMMGSTHYVEQLKKEGRTPTGMVSLEMLGFTHPKQRYPWIMAPFYPKQGNFIGVGANWHSKGLLNTFARGMRRVEGLRVETIALPGAGTLIPQLRMSDHAPFWDAGTPALMVTDTAYFRNPNYHTPKDTLKTLDLPFLMGVAQGVLEGVLEAVKE